jgi:lipopolysaccharide export system permease protein
VAEHFHMLKQNERRQMGIRLFDGAIHQIAKDASTFHRVTFQTYDFWMPSPFQSAKAKATRMSYEELRKKLALSGGKDSGMLRRLMEHHKDVAFPVSTFVLGLLGVPVGIVSRRSGKAGGFAIGVLVVIGFYMLNVLGEFLVTAGGVAPIVGAWLPNVLLAVLAGWMFNQARKQ